MYIFQFTYATMKQTDCTDIQQQPKVTNYIEEASVNTKRKNRKTKINQSRKTKKKGKGSKSNVGNNNTTNNGNTTRKRKNKKKTENTNTNTNTNNNDNTNTNNNNNENGTPGILTVNGFAEGEDGGGAAACDGQYHSNTEMIAALSTGWFAGGSRCGKTINITANGKTVQATIVDECDSNNGFDAEHAFQPPCGTNIVDVSNAVWEALGVSQNDPNYGQMPVTWSDA